LPWHLHGPARFPTGGNVPLGLQGVGANTQ
jgi:hypothetical protein